MQKTIKSGEFSTLIINKSKFISKAFNIKSIDNIDRILKEIKSEYSDSTHICYAFVLNSEGVLLEKCSDDNEPSSTAGKPILNVIKKNDLINTLIVVIRYFGGIKLGAGGLVRAYTNSGVLALKNSEICELKTYQNINLTLSYENFNFLYGLSKTSEVILNESENNFFNISVLSERDDIINLIKSKSLTFEILNEELL